MLVPLLLAHAGATAMMAGLIWVVQLVVYPAFASVDDASFPAYHRAHMRRIGPIVGPLMAVETVTALALPLALPPGPRLAAWAGVVLVGVAWGATALVAVPLHRRLAADGRDVDVIGRLVRTNWIRTLAWSARLVLVGGLLAALLAEGPGNGSIAADRADSAEVARPGDR